MTTTLYGIPNCDTVKKARAWLEAHATVFTFHDFKKQGVPEERLREWVNTLGWERVLNRAGTTFRKLPEAHKVDLDADRAVALMIANPSAIRRPVLVGDDTLLVGFSADAWKEALG